MSLVHFENTSCVVPCAVTVLVVQEHIHRKSQNSVLKLVVSFLSLGTFEKTPWIEKLTSDTFLQLGVKRSLVVSIKSLSCYPRTRKNHSNIYTQSLKGYCIRFSSHVLCTTLIGKKLDVIILKREKGI